MPLAALLLAATAAPVPARAEQVLKEEPHVGMLRTGQSVLVDNGRCPPGQVQRVTAGDNGRSGNGVVRRGRSCEKRPPS